MTEKKRVPDCISDKVATFCQHVRQKTLADKSEHCQECQPNKQNKLKPTAIKLATPKRQKSKLGKVVAQRRLLGLHQQEIVIKVEVHHRENCCVKGKVLNIRLADKKVKLTNGHDDDDGVEEEEEDGEERQSGGGVAAEELAPVPSVAGKERVVAGENVHLPDVLRNVVDLIDGHLLEEVADGDVAGVVVDGHQADHLHVDGRLVAHFPLLKLVIEEVLSDGQLANFMALEDEESLSLVSADVEVLKVHRAVLVVQRVALGQYEGKLKLICLLVLFKALRQNSGSVLWATFNDLSEGLQYAAVADWKQWIGIGEVVEGSHFRAKTVADGDVHVLALLWLVVGSHGEIVARHEDAALRNEKV